jgi:hypothetical protein
MNKKLLSSLVATGLGAALMAQSGLASAALGCSYSLLLDKGQSCNDLSANGSSQTQPNPPAGKKKIKVAVNLQKDVAPNPNVASTRLVSSTGADLGCEIKDTNPTNASTASKECLVSNAIIVLVKFQAGDNVGF